MSVITSYQSPWQFAKSSITAASTAAFSYKSQPHAGCAPHSLYPTPTNLSSLFTLSEPALVFPAVSAPAHVHFTDVTWRFGKMATAAKRKSLSLKEKIDIIKKAEDNPALSTTSIGVTSSSVG